MPIPLNSLRYLVVCALLSAGWGCYSHTGQATKSDSDRWHQLAIEACERGDQRAYQTLIERSDVDSSQAPCQLDTGSNDSTSADRN